MSGSRVDAIRYPSPEFRRFLVAGTANTIASYFVYLALLLVVSYEISYTLSTVIAILTAYALNTYYVFRTTWSWKKLFRFPGVYAVQYVTGMALMWLFVERMGIDERLAPWLVVALQVPFTFYMSKMVLATRAEGNDERR